MSDTIEAALPYISRQIQGFRVGGAAALLQEQGGELVALARLAAQGSPAGHAELQVLGGRSPVVRTQLLGVGALVVKGYFRGGLLGVLNRQWHLRLIGFRPESEYCMLLKVRELGIPAPEPVAWIVDGCFFYRGWLITREIPDSRSLVELTEIDREKALQVLESLGPIFEALIENRILHVDLHPGNVVVGPSGGPCLVDFDKAYEFRGGKNQLRDLYLRRWRRAAIKHKLPEELSEVICSKLRRNFEVVS